MIELLARLNRMSHEKRLFLYAQWREHFLESGQFDRVEQILTNLLFIEGKCSARMVDDLLSDYDAARAALGARWHEESPVASFSRFVSHNSHLLRSAPRVFYQEAFNSAEEEVSRAANDVRQIWEGTTGAWLRKTSGVIRQMHNGPVISMAFWEDERHLAVSTTALEVWVWDMARGRLWGRCETPPSAAKSLAVSPNGKYLAAALGADVPTPDISGVRVWTRNGNVHRDYDLSDWAYTVRWRNDSELVVGAGVPQGSGACGTLWRASLSEQVCQEIVNYLADRPIVLTWDPVPEQYDQMMMLSMDGILYHLTPDYVPLTPGEVSEIAQQLMADGNYDAHEARLNERRPILGRLCAPCTDTFGYQTAAQVGGPHELYILGEPPVPPELFVWHTPNADGLYFFDLEQGRSACFPFNEKMRAAGFRASCLAALPVGRRVAFGTAHGQVYTLSFNEQKAPEVVHQGHFPVTSVCFSPSGKQLAVGDAGAQVTVYDVAQKRVVFRTAEPTYVMAARVSGREVLVLHHDRLEVVPDDLPSSKESIPLGKGFMALDVDRRDNLVVILCSRYPPRLGEDDARFIKVIDLEARRVVLSVAVPGVLPISPPEVTPTETRRAFERVRLHVGGGRCDLLLSSPEGLIRYPFLAFDDGDLFVLPPWAAKRERNITVYRMGSDVPKHSCGLFVIAADRGEWDEAAGRRAAA